MAQETGALAPEEQKLFDAMREEAPVEKPQEKAAEKPVEKAAEKAAEKPVEKKEPSMVPAEALKEARATNKELRKEIDALKGVVSNGDQKLQKFIDSVSKRADEAAVPKFEDDPAANLKHENAQLRKDLGEIRDRLQKQDSATQQGDQMQKFASQVRARELAFAKEHPEYDKAAEFVAKVWRDEFIEAGWEEGEVDSMVFQKSLAMTRQAVQKEKDPAEAIWKIAKRNGFKEAAADEPKDKKQSDGETKLKTIEKGLEASKAAGGGAGPDDLTLSSLSQMDDEAIDKLVSDPDWWNKQIRRTPLH